jgi:hypothetical protein
MTNLEKLEKAGVIDSKHLSKEHQDVINTKMTDEEVDALISIKAKLAANGPAWAPRSEPNNATSGTASWVGAL